MRQYNYDTTREFIKKELELEADFNWIKSHSIIDQLHILIQILTELSDDVPSKKQLLREFKQELILIREENKFGLLNIESKLIELNREKGLKTLLDEM